MNILVIDDDERIRNFFKELFVNSKHTIFTAENGSSGYEFFLKEKIDLCFLDLWMPEIGGIDILKRIKEEFDSVEVIMISGEAKITHAVKAAKIGAYDFIEKPLSTNDILKRVEEIEKKAEEGSIGYFFKDNDAIIGKSESILQIKSLVESAAKSDARILITGENGTGKELVAREIHLKSLRKNRPFIPLNCAAIPENLIESELFGYVKGAFTGAFENKIGKMEAADRGTLFLDEVADLSLSAQAKLLRVLQEMRISRIGSVEEKTVDVRVISATNKDLVEEVKAGRFREDLYYRLNVIPIYVPPLRERKDDIPLLVEYYNRKLSLLHKKEKMIIEESAIDFMKNYTWPGNIRQLKNIIERLIVISDTGSITEEEVKKHIDDELLKENDNDAINKYDNYKLSIAKDEFERDFIEKKLRENNFNLSKTAKALGIYVSNLHSKINKLGIDISELKKEKR